MGEFRHRPGKGLPMQVFRTLGLDRRQALWKVSTLQYHPTEVLQEHLYTGKITYSPLEKRIISLSRSYMVLLANDLDCCHLKKFATHIFITD